MAERKAPNIVLEKINPNRNRAAHEAILETSEELFATGMIRKPELSLEEMESSSKKILEQWENDNLYLFYVLDASTNQFVGGVVINHVNRFYQMANLSYWVRSSRSGEGIATEAAKLAVRYGFEKLELHRIEIVIKEDNKPSLRITEKLGAVREGLLRNRILIHGTSYDAYMHSLIPEDIKENNTA